MLVDGQWVGDWHPVQSQDGQGRFLRQTSTFRHWVTPDGSPGPTGEGGFPAEAGRYHLYVALICPWASRTLIARRLKKLDHVIGVTVAEPLLTEQGWAFGDFPGADRDGVNGVSWVHELYTRADPHFTGRATVPVLWDTRRNTIVNNESADVLRMLNRAFDAYGDPEVDLCPPALRGAIDTLNRELYQALNNGVYQCGFASSQSAYDEAVVAVFACLDRMEARLSDGRRFLFGATFTESDIRLFVTLVRFDAAYHGLFKCNLRRIVDYPALSAYVERVLALAGIADTVNMQHIKHGYYSIKVLNPSGIVPMGPRPPVGSDTASARVPP